MASLSPTYQWKNFHHSPIIAVAVSPGGDLLAAASEDGGLLFFELKNGDAVHMVRMDLNEHAVCINWTSEDELLVSLSTCGIRVLKVDLAANSEVSDFASTALTQPKLIRGYSDPYHRPQLASS